jgi:hypothetical protein
VAVLYIGSRQSAFSWHMFYSILRTKEKDTRQKNCITQVKGKGKAIPLQAWTGPEDSLGLKLPYFKTIDT